MDSTGSIVQSGISRLLGKALSSAREGLSSELAIGSTVAVVLLLEDDPEVAERIAQCLNRAGYRTLAVADVELAAALAQRRSVAMVLLNWRLLTRLGGSVLIEELRRRSPHGHLPMIVISADQSELMEANRLGIDDYVPNPFHADDLLHVVDEYCR
jgi:two-component system response regulator AdeR